MSISNQKIVFVLGSKGSGKGTLCQRLVSESDYVYIYLGDILRNEI